MRFLAKRQQNLRTYNSKQEKQKRIEQSRHANESKGRKRLEDKKDEPIRVDPKTVLELVFHNPVTGKVHFIQFHNIRKKRTFRVTDNGRFWLTGSYTTVFNKLKGRCPILEYHD